MKIVTLLGLVALVGCAHEPARVAAPSTKSASSDPANALKIDRTGSVDQQLARLQDAYDKNAEAIDFLNKVYAQQKAQAAQRDRDEPDPDAMFAVNVTDDLKAGQVDGPADAPVTIVKAFDFACPYCSRVAPVMAELVHDYHGKVRVVYVNMVVHAVARPAHLASCAAAKQGKYIQFKDAFWDKGFGPYVDSGGKDQSALGEDNILAIARDLGLDPVKLKTDMSSAECEARITGDMAEMAKFHVNATPTFFINGHVVSGARAKEEFKVIIDEQLKIAEASGIRGADYYTKVVLGKGEKQFRSKVDAKH